MKRRQAREIALQALFQLDLNPGEAEKKAQYEQVAIDTAFAELPDDVHIDGYEHEFVKDIVTGTRSHLEDIDAAIRLASKKWKLERMAVVDRNLIRMAIYEMRYADIPAGAALAINEAVELAKKYGTDDSSKYVNGILGTIVANNEAD